jgi:hypothetical protein
MPTDRRVDAAAGGVVPERQEWTDGDRQAIADVLFGSPFAEGLDDRDHRDLLDSVLWFGTDYGPAAPRTSSTSSTSRTAPAQDLVAGAVGQGMENAGFVQSIDGAVGAARRCPEQADRIVCGQDGPGGSGAVEPQRCHIPHRAGEGRPPLRNRPKSLCRDARLRSRDAGRDGERAEQAFELPVALVSEQIEVAIPVTTSAVARGTTTRVVTPRRRRIELNNARPMRPLP